MLILPARLTKVCPRKTRSGLKKNLGNKGILFLLLVTVLSACRPAKNLGPNEYLLEKNNIVTDKSLKIEKPELEGYIRQKPNRKILGVFRFHLGVYNMVDKRKMDARKILHDQKTDNYNLKGRQKTDEENITRRAKGKKEKVFKPRRKDKLTWREWLVSIGEPPVIVDSFLINKSVSQLHLFLQSKGYFNNLVTDSVKYYGKKANVTYYITSNKPYTIRSLSWDVQDEYMKYYVFADTSYTKIRTGNNYDADALNAERDRIALALRNNGYWQFGKEYVYYRVDSALASHQVDITVEVKKFLVRDANDSLIEMPHKRFYINNVYFRTDYDPKRKTAPSDTFYVKESFGEKTEIAAYLLYDSLLKFKPEVIMDALFLRKGDLFQQKNVENTYRRLSDTKAFKLINISFSPSDKPDGVDCFINLTPVVKQSISGEAQVKNSQGDLGLTGYLVYQNRNTFHGLELLDIRLKGGMEIQKELNAKGSDQSNIPFNTIEIGPEASLEFPRFMIPFYRIKEVSINSNPKTTFSVAYNYQSRTEYSRSILKNAWSYSWKESAYWRWIVTPLEVNIVNVPRIDSNFINSSDPIVLTRFKPHFISDARMTWIFSNQDIRRKKRSFSFFRLSIEGAGQLLRVLTNAYNWNIAQLPKSDEGGYKIGGTVFSQYLRGDADYRFYKNLRNADQLAFRVYLGIGYPFTNLRELPFEKSFFAGGPSSIRAWRTRTLGPGGLPSGLESGIIQIGDNQQEINLEYRFTLTPVLKMAFFADGGNIWLRKADPLRPDGEFNFSRFLGQYAIGGGLGVRLDFNFFVVRFDAAWPLKDPAQPEGKRWVVNKLAFSDMVLNFGIGYPF